MVTNQKRLSPPPTREGVDVKDGKLTEEWKRWFSLLLTFTNNLQKQIE